MVIATSNSCNTLTSLDDVRKFGQFDFCESGDKASSPTYDYVRTNICLPEDDLGESSSSLSTFESLDEETSLYLPACEEDPVDLCLRSIPQVMESADELHASPLKRFTAQSTERLVYVGQGEVAHTSSAHCDVICSDKATTCHILAFRSESPERGPLVSLTHIDDVGYESCIRNMVREHKILQTDEEENKCDTIPERLTIDVYMMGGFEDEDARAISNYLLRLISQMADEDYTIKFVLKTCAISSMNDDGNACPIGRGMGVNVHTGEAFLCKVDDEAAGPSPQLRSARIWSGQSGKSLSLVASTRSNNKMCVAPFTYKPLAQMDVLLGLENTRLLAYTSTSPEVEEDDFCMCVRSTLRFMGSVKCEAVFGAAVDQPAYFIRVGQTNQWKRTTQF